MKLTKYGHSCLLLEESGARILIDPGVFSRGFESQTGVNAVLITHQHPDHLAPDNLVSLLSNNPDVLVYADEGSAEVLKQDTRLPKVQTVRAGDRFEIAGVEIAVEGADHALIHPDISGIPNVGYRIADRFFYPGDAFTTPAAPVEVLALPLGAPWLKVAEVVEYLRLVRPKIAVPVHDAVLAMPDMHEGIIRRLTAHQGTELRVVPNGDSIEV